MDLAPANGMGALGGVGGKWLGDKAIPAIKRAFTAPRLVAQQPKLLVLDLPEVPSVDLKVPQPQLLETSTAAGGAGGGTGQFPSSARVGTGEIKLLPMPQNMAQHHIFPQNYKPWFTSKGINIDDFVIDIEHFSTHLRGVHGKGLGPSMPGKWNPLWAKFIDKNPNATPSEIFKFAEDLLYRFQLHHLPYHKYTK